VSSIIVILKISITFSSLVISQTLFGVPSRLNAAKLGLTTIGKNMIKPYSMVFTWDSSLLLLSGSPRGLS
jgi:hypothetical protein